MISPVNIFNLSLFSVPDDAPRFLEQIDRKHNQLKVRWKTCTSWNGPKIGFELKAFYTKENVTHEISKPMVYVINFIQKCVHH